MFRENKFVKFIACTIVACFSYSFVLFEPLYGAVQEYRDGALARAMSSKMERFVLPYRYGRVMGGSYSGGERLVVFVQDLHCHPEVQRNISEIENLLDKRYGLEKIFVEGAPMGRVDTKVLDTMPARIKDKVLESLLDQGLLSGSEYYAVKNKQDKLYGLEEWGTYLGNYNRIKRLIESRDGRVKAAQDVAARIEAIKREHLSPELRKLERYIKKAEAPGADKSALAKTGKKSEEHYFELEKLGAKVNEDVSQYPNLKKFIDMARFGREINYKKLPTQMQEYVEELKKVVPFGVYRQLTKKLEEGNREEEYYFAMSEIAAQYAPLLNTRYPEVNKFLAYIRLNYSINPIYLVNEEKGFGERILDKTAKRLVDKELIFLSRMSEAFAGMADLKVTPEEYGYFKENVGRYRALLQKYISRDELSDAMAVMGDEDLYKYFEVNIGRNDIFSSVIIDKEQGSGGAAATLGYEAVLSNINKFSKIDVVVTGGFHSEVVKALDKAGISYVAVTPNATKMFDEGVYERLMVGRLEAKDIMRASLAPALISAGATPQQANALVTMLAGLTFSENSSKNRAEIDRGINELVEWFESANLQAKTTLEIDRSKNAVTIGIGLDKWLVSADPGNGKKIKMVRKTPEFKNKIGELLYKVDVSRNGRTIGFDASAQSTAEDDVPLDPRKKVFAKTSAVEDKFYNEFSKMSELEIQDYLRNKMDSSSGDPLAAVTTQIEKVMDTDTNNKFALLEAFFRVLEANDGYLIGHYLGNIKANIEQMTDGPIVTRLYSLQDQEKIMEDLFKQRAFARRIFEIWETSLASQGRVKTDSSQSGFADPLLLMGLAGAALLFGALGFVGLGIISSALLHDIYYFYMQNGSLNGYGFAGLPRRVAKRFTVLLALARGKPEIISGEKVPGINAALLSLKLSPEKFNEMVRGKLVAGITALGQMKDRSHGIYVRMPVETAMGVLSDEDGFAAIREKFSNLKNPYIGVAECGGVSEMNYGYHNAIPDLLIPLQVAIVNEFLKPLGGMAVRSSGTRIYFVCPGNIRPEKMEAVRNGLREILARSIDDLLAYDEVTFDEAVVDPKNSEQVKAAVAGVSSVLAGQDKIAGVFQSRDGVFLLYEQKYRGDVLNALNLNKNGGAALRLVNKSGGSSNTGSIRNMVTDFTVVKAQGTDSLETAIVKAEIIQQSLPSGIVLPEGSRNEFTVDRDAVSNLDRIETEAVSRRIAANEGNDYIKRLVNNDGSGWFENGLVSGSRLNDVLASFLKYENPPQFFKAQMKFRITDNSIVGTKQSRAGWDDVKCTDYGYDKETDTFNYRIFRRLYGAFVSQKIIRALTSAIDSEVLKIKRNEVPLVSGTEYFSFIPTQEGFGGLTEKQFSVIADKSTNAIRNLLSGEIGLSGIEPEISMHVINAGDAGRFQLADVANRLSEAGESDDLFDEVKSPSGNIIRLFNVSKAGALMRNTERIRLVKRYLGRVAQLHRHMYLVRNKLRSSRESTERLQLNNELKDLELEEKDLKLELTGKINSRLEEEKASLKSEGIKDAMTGNLVEGKITYSKAHFENIVLRDAIGNAKRNNKNIFFSMFDGDNFKSINDKYGHEAGDIVIKAFAIVARKVLRSTDQLARFGGDEFAAIVESGDHDFDSSDAENRLTAAERLRKAFSDSDSVMLYAEIEKMDRALADKMRADKRTFSISVGVVRYDPQDKSLANMGVKEIASILKKRADVALYYAKEGKYVKDGEMHPSANGGRNNSLVWDPVMGDKTPEEKRREERGLLINEISKILPEGLVADVVSGVPEEVTRIQQKMSRYNFGVFYSGGKIWISSEADEKIVLGSAQLAKNTDKSLGFLKDKNDLNELLRDNIELYYITNTDILLISEKEPDEKSVFDSISGDEGLIGIGLLAEMSLVVIGIGLFLAGNPITAGFVGFAAAGLFVLEFVVSRGKKSAPARSSALSPEALRQRAVERAVLASGEKLPRARILGLVGDLASRTPSKKQAGVLGNEKGNTVLYLTGLTLTGVAIAIIAAGNYFTGGALAAVTLGAFAIFKGRNFLVARSENSANAKLLDQGINELAAEIKNSNPAVSLAAKKAVAGIFAARALKENIDIQQLADMLGDEAELGPVYAAMVNSGQMKIEDLKALPKNEKWQVRRAAVAALGIYYSDKDPRKVKFAVGEISDMLIDKNKEVRDSAGESFAALLATLVRNGRMETSALIATSREISGLSIIVSASMASDDTSGFKNAIADMKNYKEAVRKNSGLDSLLLGSGFESMNDDLAAVAFRAYGMHRALSLALAQLYAEQEAGGADINVGVAEKIVRDNGFNAANPVGLDALYAAMVARGRMTIDDLMAMRNSGKQLLIRDAGKALITVFADKASRGEISFNRETGEIGVPETLDKASLGPVYAAMALRGDISTEYLRELAQNSKTRAVALEALGVVYMDLASRVEKPGIIDRAISSQRTPGSFLSGFFTRRGITRGSPEVVSLTNGQKAELWRAKVWGNIEANLSQEDSEFQRTVRDNLKHAIDQIAENMANGEANPELVNLKVNEYDTIKPSVKGDRRVGAFALAGNPLHWGQLVTALEAMAQKKLDKVVFILQGPGDPDKPEMDVTLKERAEMGRELLKIFEGICEVSEVSYATQGRGEKTVFDLSEWNQGAVEGKGSLTFAYLVGSDHQHYWAPKVIEANKNNPEFFNQKIEDLIKADIADNPDAQKRGDGKRFNELDTIGKFDYNLTQYAQDLKKRGHAMEVHFNVRPGFESEYMDQEKTRIEEVGSKFQFASFVGQRFEASSTAIRNWITGKASPEAEIILPKTIKRMIESEAYKQYRAVLFMLAYIKDKGKANPELKKVPLVEMAHRKMMLDSIGKEITPENLLAGELKAELRAKAELWRAKVWGNIEANLSQEDSEFQRTVRDNLKHAIDQIAENMANGEANPELVNLKVNEYDTIKPSVKGDRRVGAFALAGNPLHWGQLVTALEAMAQKKLDKVVFILQGPGDPDKPEMDVTLKERAEMGRELLKIFEGICEVSEVSYATQGRGEKTVFDLSEWNQGAVEGKGSLTFAYLVGSDHQHYWAPKVIEANKNNPEFFNQKIEDLIKADIADNPDAQKRGDGKRFNELDTIGKFDYNLTQYAQDLKKRGHAMEVHFNVRPGFESEYMDQEKTRIEEVGSKFQFASFVGQRFEASSTAIRNWITGKASPEAEIILPKTIKRMIESEAYKQYRAVLFMLAYIKDKGKANPELKKVPLVEMAHRKMMLDSIGKEITPENLLAAETTSKVINNQKGYISLKFSVGILSATIGVLIGLLLGVQYGAITFLISYLTILSFRKALDMSIKVLFNKKYDKNPADNYNEISDEERALIVELNWLKDRIARVEPIIKRVEIEEGDFEPIWWTHLEIKKVVEESNPEYWSLRNEITRVEQLLNSEREKRKQNIKAGATSTLKSIFLAAALSATMLVVGFTNAQAGQNMASGMPMPVTASSVQLETRSAVSAIADAYRQSEELPAPIIGMQTSKIREELSSLLENCRNDVIKTKISSDGKFSERRVTGRIKNVNAVVEKLYEEMRVSGHLDTYMLQMDPEIAKALVLYSIADPVDYQAWKNQNITIEMKANLGGMASTGGDEFGGFYGNPSVFIRKDNNINPFMLFTMMLHEFSHVEESAANFIEFNWKYNLYQAALDFVSDVRPEEKRAFTRMYDKLKTQFGIEVTNADDAQMNAQRSMLYNKWPFVLIGIFNSISFQLLPMFLLFKAASFIFRGGKKNSGKNINQARRLQGSPRARVTTPEPEYEAAVKQVEREISENGSVTKLPATKSSKQTLRKMMLSIVFSAALSVTVFMAGFASAQTRLWNNIPVGDFAGVDASLDKEIAYYLDTIAAQYEENDLNQVQRIKTGNILPGDFEALNKKLNEETANYLKVKAAEYERNIVEPKVVESETWDSATIIGNSIAAIIFAILTHRFFLRLYWASVRTYYSIYYWNYDRKIINGLEKPKLGKKYTFEAWGYTPGLLLLFSQMIERAPDLAVPTGRFRVWQETIVTFEEFAKNNGGLVLLRGHGGWRDFSGEYTLIFGNRTHLKFTVENEHNVRVKCTVYLHKDLHNKTLNDFGTDLRRKFNLANSGYSRKWWRGRYFDPLIIVALSSILSVPGLAYASANASDTKVFTIAGLLAVSVGAVAELASRIKSKKLETVVDNSKPEPQPTDPLDAAQKMVQNAVSPKDAAGLITNSIAGDKSWVAKNIPQIAGKNNILVYMPENMSNAQTLAAERSKLGIQTISIGLLTGQVKNDVPLDFLGLFPIRIKDGYMSVQVYFFKSQSGLELYVAPADKAYAHSGVAVGNMAMAIVNELNDNKAATIQSKAMLSSALVAIVNELKDGYLKDRFKGLGFGGEAWQIELDSDKEMLATLDSLIVDSSMRRRVLLSFWADQNAETPDYFKEKANSYSALNEAALKERKEKKDSKDASFTNIGFNTAIESLRGETEMLLGNTANIEPLAKNLQDSGVSRIVLMAGLNLSGITDLVPEIKLLVKDYKLDPAAADRLINGLKDMNISDNVINAETAGGFRNAAGGVAREALKLKFNGSDSALKDSLNANGRGYYELLMNIAMENWLALNPGKGSENREAVLSKYSKEIMFEAYLAGLFIGQLKIAAKNSREKYGIDVMLDLGKVDAAFMVSAVEKAGALLENGVVSGLQFSISGYANNEEKELFLSALKNRIDNGVRMGLIDRNVPIIIRSGREDISLVKKYGFEAGVDVKAKTAAELDPDLVSDGASLYVRPGAEKSSVGLLEKVLGLGAAGVMIELGGVDANGNVIKLPMKVEASGMLAFNDLLGLLDNIPFVEVMTPEAREFAGERSGKIAYSAITAKTAPEEKQKLLEGLYARKAEGYTAMRDILGLLVSVPESSNPSELDAFSGMVSSKLKSSGLPESVKSAVNDSLSEIGKKVKSAKDLKAKQIYAWEIVGFVYGFAGSLLVDTSPSRINKSEVRLPEVSRLMVRASESLEFDKDGRAGISGDRVDVKIGQLAGILALAGEKQKIAIINSIASEIGKAGVNNASLWVELGEIIQLIDNAAIDKELKNNGIENRIIEARRIAQPNRDSAANKLVNEIEKLRNSLINADAYEARMDGLANIVLRDYAGALSTSAGFEDKKALSVALEITIKRLMLKTFELSADELKKSVEEGASEAFRRNLRAVLSAA